MDKASKEDNKSFSMTQAAIRWSKNNTLSLAGVKAPEDMNEEELDEELKRMKAKKQ